MKTLILILIISVIYFKPGFPQEFGYSEFYVANRTGSTFSGGHEIKIKIYPVGAVFPATVGVPKSLLIIFEIKFTLCANFLVTNSKALSD